MKDPILFPEFECAVCGDFGHDPAGFLRKGLCVVCAGEEGVTDDSVSRASEQA